MLRPMNDTRQMMKAVVDLQICTDGFPVPDQARCELIVLQVLETLGVSESKECTVRIVGLEESAALNQQYRNKIGATNVLSFPFESPVEMDIDLLGDLVICAPLVISEAIQQNKSKEMHWTHLIVHGCLHLSGYDHLNETDAEIMEGLERKILDKLGFTDPYQVIDPA